MQNLNHALATLRDQTGIPTLDFDPDGNLTLLFDGDTEVNLNRVDDATVEVWTPLDELGRGDDVAALRRLLEANHLGEGTGAARMALSPARDRMVLCERIDVRPLDGVQFADRIVGFLKYASFWASDAVPPLSAARDGTAEGFSPGDFVVRA